MFTPSLTGVLDLDGQDARIAAKILGLALETVKAVCVLQVEFSISAAGYVAVLQILPDQADQLRIVVNHEFVLRRTGGEFVHRDVVVAFARFEMAYQRQIPALQNESRTRWIVESVIALSFD